MDREIIKARDGRLYVRGCTGELQAVTMCRRCSALVDAPLCGSCGPRLISAHELDRLRAEMPSERLRHELGALRALAESRFGDACRAAVARLVDSERGTMAEAPLTSLAALLAPEGEVAP